MQLKLPPTTTSAYDAAVSPCVNPIIVCNSNAPRVKLFSGRVHLLLFHYELSYGYVICPVFFFLNRVSWATVS